MEPRVTAPRKLDFSKERTPPSKLQMTIKASEDTREVRYHHPRPQSKSRVVRPAYTTPSTSNTPTALYILDPSVKFPTRSRSQLRPWLERRKKELRTATVESEVQLRKDHALNNVRPRMVRPPNKAMIGTWQRVQHPKFPHPPVQQNRKTWRRRELRRRAQARREADNANMDGNVATLSTTLEKFKFNNANNEIANGEANELDLPLFKVSADMSFEDLVQRGLEPWRAKVLLEQARLDERLALVQRKEAELQAKIDAHAKSIDQGSSHPNLGSTYPKEKN
ncbi:hypothetical protein COLO4_28169, partial [Corchorus olitorius]